MGGGGGGRAAFRSNPTGPQMVDAAHKDIDKFRRKAAFVIPTRSCSLGPHPYLRATEQL